MHLSWLFCAVSVAGAGAQSTASPVQIGVLVENAITARDDDMRSPVGGLDSGALRRIVYHVAMLGAEDGRDHVVKALRPDFGAKCSEDLDCVLALDGLPASVVKSVMSAQRLPCPEKDDCGTEDIAEMLSKTFAKAARDASIGAILLIDSYNGDPKPTKEDLIVIAELTKWTDNDHIRSKHKDLMRDWAYKYAKVFFAGDAAAPSLALSKPSTSDAGRSAFLVSLFAEESKHCLGDSYLCPADPGQGKYLQGMIALLWTLQNKHVTGKSDAHKNNPLRLSLRRLAVPNPTSPHALGEMAKGSAKGRDPEDLWKARQYFEDVKKKTRLNGESTKHVFETMRYTTEVFDHTTGRIWHPTLRLDSSRTLPAGLQALGYLPLIAVDDTGAPMIGHEQVRWVTDLDPVSGGRWAPVMVPSADANANGSSPNHKRSLEEHTFAPTHDHWHVPAHARFIRERQRLSRRDSAPAESGYIPDVRVFEALYTEMGSPMTDSIGLPIIRTVDIKDGNGRANPVMQSLDAAIIKGSKESSLMGLRLYGAKGTPLQSIPMEFVLDKDSVGGNALSGSEDHVKFRELGKSESPRPLFPNAATRSKDRHLAKVYEIWAHEKVDTLMTDIARNIRDFKWLNREKDLNSTTCRTDLFKSKLGEVLAAIEDAVIYQQLQIKSLDALGKSVDDKFADDLYNGKTPPALSLLSKLHFTTERLVEISNALKASLWSLHQYGEGKESKEMDDLANSLRTQDKGFPIKAIAASKALAGDLRTTLEQTAYAYTLPSSPINIAPSGTHRKRDSGGKSKRQAGHILTNIPESPPLTPGGVNVVPPLPDWLGSPLIDTPPLGQGFPWMGSARPASVLGTSPWAGSSLHLPLPEGQSALSPVSSLSSSGTSGTSLGPEVRAYLWGKIPWTAIGWGATGVNFAVSATLRLVTQLKPDNSCPRPKFRTEMWNAEAAAMTTLRSPCTDTKHWFPTPTESHPVTIEYNFAEATGGVPFQFDSIRKSHFWSNNSSWNTTTSVNEEKDKSSTGNKIFWNTTASRYKESDRSGTGNQTSWNATASQYEGLNKNSTANFTHGIDKSSAFRISKTEMSDTPLWERPCPKMYLDSDFIEIRVPELPCPVPTPAVCGINWYHLHINDLPPGIRAPNYCEGADLAGHQRAKSQGCLPDFKSKECKNTFGLGGDAHDKLKSEQKAKAKKAEEDLDKLYEEHDKKEDGRKGD